MRVAERLRLRLRAARDQQRKARLVGEKPRKPSTERAVAAEDENFEVRWSGQRAVASPHSREPLAHLADLRALLDEEILDQHVEPVRPSAARELLFLLRVRHRDRALVVNDHALKPQVSRTLTPLAAAITRHLRRREHARHRRVAVQVLRGHLQTALGGNGQQRRMALYFRRLRAIDVARETSEFRAIAALRHPGAHRERLLVVNDHVLQEREIGVVVERRRSLVGARQSGAESQHDRRDDGRKCAAHIYGRVPQDARLRTRRRAARGGPEGRPGLRRPRS